ncbi:MAG: beta strand repeat-containing protein [Burkholderiaceae bacterium]
MAFTLEITQTDGSIIVKELDALNGRYESAIGDQFVLLNADGQPASGLKTSRQGNDLIVEGLPEAASLELCDFFKPDAEDDSCVLTLPDAPMVSASNATPVLLAAKEADTKTDAAAAKEAATEAKVESVSAEEAASNPALKTGAIALGAIVLVAGAASAGSSSDDSGDNGTTPPTPVTGAPGGSLEGSDLTISAAEASNGVVVSGTAPAGSAVVVTLGNVSTQVTADANGNYTATLDGASLPGNGTYPLSVTATADGATPTTTQLGDVTIATNGAGNLTATDADSATLTGFDGTDVLVGGNNVSVTNGGFETWDLTGFNSTNNGTTASGVIYDSTSFTPNQSIQIESVEGNPGQPGIGWTVDFDNTPGGASAITTGNVGFNGFEDTGNPGNSSTFGRIELITDGTTPGNYSWETVTSETSGGGGLVQTLNTTDGQSYSLSMDAVVPNSTGQPSDSHNSAGTSIEIRWGGTTVAFFDATAASGDGAWLTTGGLVAPTVDGTTWTFANLAASGATTDIGIIAYEQYQGSGDPITAFNDGVGLRLDNIAVQGADGAAAQTISGGTGADLIYGQGGDDILYGGVAGANDTDSDTFIFSMANDNGADTIMDFTVGTDRIILVDVANADTTNSQVPGDTRLNTSGDGTGESADGTASNETTNSSNNLTIDDLVVTGTQSIAVTETGGNTVLTFSGNGGEALGSVTLNGVTGQVGADDSASLTNLTSAGIISFTGDAYSSQLINTV